MSNKIILSFILILVTISAKSQFQHQNINYLGSYSDPAVAAEFTYGIKYQSCWGWVDTATGDEYGIIGSTAGTYIVNVTNPTNPVLSDYIPHRQTDCIWHEYKTFQNYLYIISDDAGSNSFQIADLSYLPDSVHVIHDSTNIFERAHTLFVDGNKLYVASVKTLTNTTSMSVYSLANPSHPALLRELNQDYPFISAVHDMFVSNDSVYASCGYDGLQIFKYDSVSNSFNLLGSLQDASNIYNHSSCLSPDFTTLYVCEEVPDGRPIKVVDVSNISSPALIDTFHTNINNTPHNPFLLDSLLIIAAYQDGVYIYNVSNASTPVLMGYFDTYPANPPGTYPWPPYAGAWAAYPYLPSGTLLVSDMQSGLFCLDISGITNITSTKENLLKIYPNPTSGILRTEGISNAKLEFINSTGQLCLEKVIQEVNTTLDVSTLKPGIYSVRILMKDRVVLKKVVVR